MSLAKGRLVVGLVREFLEWCNLEFTLKVFEPEIGKDVGGSSNRSSLLRQLVSPSEGAKSTAGSAHTYLSFPLAPTSYSPRIHTFPFRACLAPPMPPSFCPS